MTREAIKPGDIVAERYTVLALINAGPAASVYRAADLSAAGTPVALKVVAGEQGGDVLDEFFGREVDSLRRLRHPNVVRLLDAGRDSSNRRWLALEWLERGTLQDTQWQTFHRDPMRLLELLRDLLHALAAAHRRGVIHRDIKPGNILFDTMGRPKLADFNVSKLLGRTRSTTTVRQFFTARWASPEQKEGKPADERTDVFALGRIAAEILTGSSDEELGPLLQRLERANCPGPLRHLVRRMLALDLPQRPTAVEALQEVETILRSIGPESRVPMRLTHSVTETLSQLQGGATTPKDVLDLVRIDLGGRLNVEPTTLGASHGGTTYTLVGKRYSYRAVASQDLGDSADELTLVSAIRMPAHQREAQRTNCLVLPAVADVVPAGVTAGRGSAVRAFATAFAEEKTRIEAVRGQQRMDLARLEAWQSYLDLSRAVKSERSRIAVLRRAIDLENEGLIECQIDSLFAAPEEIQDAWVSYVAPAGNIIRLGLIVDANKARILVRPHDEFEGEMSLPAGGQLVRDARQEEASLQRQAAALSMLRQRGDSEGDLLDLLARPDRVSAARRVPIVPQTLKLDKSNQDVVEAALGTERVFLVQGPPGTGKTTVIAELIAQILRREGESRILLVSQSNVAIDNVLERLQLLAPSVPAVRLGRPDKIGVSTRHFMLHDRLAAEAQRLRTRAAAAHEKMTKLCVRDVAEVEMLRRELSSDSTSEGDRRAALELADEVVGTPSRASDDGMIERLLTAQSLLARGESELADLLQLQSQWQERVQASEELEELMLKSIRVIAGTCVGVVANKAIANSRFDWVIVDEAGRASPPELLVPLVRGRRLVLLGDHRQLPPVLDDEVTQKVVEQLAIAKEELERSLFEELFEAVPDGARSRLRQQYRMHPDIGGLIEHVFYPDGLEHAVDPKDRQLGIQVWGAALRWLDTGSIKHHAERSVGYSFQNPAETTVILAELEALERKLPESITSVSVAVLAGYSAQAEALEDALSTNRRGWKRMSVAILTVDAAQGKEYDLVFYSAVRSNAAGRIGFLRDERRLNVALSRARSGLTIVGDQSALVMAGTRFGANPFVGIQNYFAKATSKTPVVRLSR